jgi:hypothetical protein
MNRTAWTGVRLPAARLRPELAAYFALKEPRQRSQTQQSYCGVLAELAEQGRIR